MVHQAMQKLDSRLCSMEAMIDSVVGLKQDVKSAKDKATATDLRVGRMEAFKVLLKEAAQTSVENLENSLKNNMKLRD